MELFNPGVSYKTMDVGKAHLARTLENMFNAEKMFVQQRDMQNRLVDREIKHKFDAYPKLNPKIQEHYNVLFGKHAGASTPKPTNAAQEEASQVPVSFGFGAFQSHSGGTSYLPCP